MLTLPTIIFGLVIALLLGALYLAIRGGGGWRLLLYFGLSIAGFAAGHLIGLFLGWNFVPIGSLHWEMGILGSALFMIVGEWLSRIEVSR